MLKKIKSYRNSIKTLVLPFIGFLIVLFFIVTAYNQNYLFLDQLIVSSLILMLVFIMKTISPNSISHKDSKYVNQNFDNLK
jgi:uncharacterized membrane protein YccC